MNVDKRLTDHRAERTSWRRNLIVHILRPCILCMMEVYRPPALQSQEDIPQNRRDVWERVRDAVGNVLSSVSYIKDDRDALARNKRGLVDALGLISAEAGKLKLDVDVGKIDQLIAAIESDTTDLLDENVRESITGLENSLSPLTINTNEEISRPGNSGS